jgi:hypothetical protein
MAAPASADSNRDRDLEGMPNDRLLKEIAYLTDRIDQVNPWRTRRVRAMRILRGRDVPRPEIAKVARMTPGAVRNLIDALQAREQLDPVESD